MLISVLFKDGMINYIIIINIQCIAQTTEFPFPIFLLAFLLRALNQIDISKICQRRSLSRYGMYL